MRRLLLRQPTLAVFSVLVQMAAMSLVNLVSVHWSTTLPLVREAQLDHWVAASHGGGGASIDFDRTNKRGDNGPAAGIRTNEGRRIGGGKKVLDVAGRSKPLQWNDSSPMITAAVCHPTLFGKVNFERVKIWLSYYRALGFDHVFMWYHPQVRNIPGFDEIDAMPFVSLYPVSDEAETKHYHGQNEVERECFSDKARNYTWAIAIDADEFLWLRAGPDVKAFLAANNHRAYLSFGKWMYTMRYRDERQDTLFGGLNRHAFTPKSVCYMVRGSPRCPTWAGRCKVMARPDRHTHIGIHGDPRKHKDAVQFHTDEAHIKEWPGLLVFDTTKTEPRRNQSFVVEANSSNWTELNIHWLFKAHRQNPNGSVTMTYDPELHGWFEAIASRLSTSGSAA